MKRSLFEVKVCGLTRVEDVDDALAAGADAIGVVHHPASPRHVGLEVANSLLRRRRAGVCGVLVVVDQPRERLASFVETLGSTSSPLLVQLCGQETPSAFAGFPAPIVRRIAAGAGALAEIAAWSGVAAVILLDHPDAPGGTGLEVDLEAARGLCAAHPCILAGGLDAHNVAERIEASGCAGVDASSRLESRPGLKDRARVIAFVQAARAAFAARGGAA